MIYAFFDSLHKSMTIFIDDFSTQSFIVDHLDCLRESFDHCRYIEIALNPNKIFIVVQCRVLLDYVVCKNGREPNLEKVEIIMNLQPSSTIKEVQRTFGHVHWYHEVIHDYAT